MIAYLLELSLYWTGLWGLYFLVLRQEKFFQINRFYLLLSVVAGLLLPLVEWAVPVAKPTWLNQPIIYLQAVNVQPGNIILAERVSTWSSTDYLLLAFLLISFLSAYRFALGLYRIIGYIRQGEQHWHGSICQVYSNDINSPFSWMSYLFLPANHDYDQATLNQIQAHETAHIRQGHSWDMLLIELLGIVCWWHPLWYAYRRSLRNVHEYLADAAAVNRSPVKAYGQLLLRQTLGVPSLSLVSTFYTSPLKQRIMMLTKQPSSNWALLKYALVLPLLVLLFLACEESVQSDAAQEIEEAIEAQTFERVDTVHTFDPATGTESTEVVKLLIHNEAQQMPIFGDCEGLEAKDIEDCSNKNLLNFIYTNVKYPKEAAKAGQEGTAVITMVIRADGSSWDHYIDKEKSTSHEALNKEALRVVSMLGDFQPGIHDGKPVNVQMVLPIKFKLE